MAAPLALRLAFRRSLIFLFLSLLAVSLSLYLALGVLSSLYGLQGEIANPTGRSSLTVLSGPGLSPLTSIVSVERLKSELADPTMAEFYAMYLSPVIVEGEVYTLRGMELNVLNLVDSRVVIVGGQFDSSCGYCVWLGEDVAVSLGVEVEDWIALYSPFTGGPYIVKVEGIIVSDTVLSGEIVSGPGLVQRVRGLSQGYASIALAEEGSLEGLEAFEGVGGIGEYALIVLSARPEAPGIQLYERASDFYLSRLGIPRGAFLAALSALTIIVSLGCLLAGLYFSRANEDNLRTLWLLGVSRFRIGVELSIITLSSAITSSLLAYYLITFGSPVFNFNFLGYAIVPELESSIALLPVLFTGFWANIGVWLAWFKD